MNIENKQIVIDSLSVTSFPPKTVVTVIIQEEIINNIYKTIGTYTLSFERTYQNTGDPELLAEIASVLEGIPE